MAYNTDGFKKDLEQLHITLSEEQIEQLFTYYELLVEWNSVMNLTSIIEFDDIVD